MSGPSAVGGSSAVDKNYTHGSIGFGVKDVIAKFDNVQVCGCAPMLITASDLTFPTGTGVTLSLTDAIYGLPAPGPVDWLVTPSDSGTFSDNPSTGATVVFTRSLTGAFPDEFDAIDALGCIAMLLPPPPGPTCMTQDFEASRREPQPTPVLRRGSGRGWSRRTPPTATSKGIAYYRPSSYSGVRLIRASAGTYSAIWSNHDAVDLYDDYTVEVDVRPTNTSTGGGALLQERHHVQRGLLPGDLDRSSGNTRVRLLLRYTT